MHEDVEAAETRTDRIGDHGAAFGGGDIGRDKLVSMSEMAWSRPCCGKHGCACVPKRCNDRFADPLGTTGDERTFALYSVLEFF
jgi:hypothetical protein